MDALGGVQYSRISTHAPRTGSDGGEQGERLSFAISTHAPRTGSDRLRLPRHAPGDISTHAPRTGSDDSAANLYQRIKKFQPTLPARGATRETSRACSTGENFNPRSPHGERHVPIPLDMADDIISTHAPRTGSDGKLLRDCTAQGDISTHAPRTGSDACAFINKE